MSSGESGSALPNRRLLIGVGILLTVGAMVGGYFFLHGLMSNGEAKLTQSNDARETGVSVISDGAPNPANVSKSPVQNEIGTQVASEQVRRPNPVDWIRPEAKSQPQSTGDKPAETNPGEVQRPASQQPAAIQAALPRAEPLSPPTTPFEIFTVGLMSADEPLLLLELLEEDAAVATTTLPPESPAAAQNYQISIVLTRNEKTPKGDLKLSLPVGAYMRPLHEVGEGKKKRWATYRKECDLIVREPQQLTWPADQLTIAWKKIPVLAVHAAEFYPSRDCRLEMTDARGDFAAILFDKDFAAQPLDWRQMALCKASGARVNATAYSKIFPTPDWKRMSDAERKLLDAVKAQSVPLARELDIARSNRARDRRLLADLRRRVLVQIGGKWSLYYLLRVENNRYCAARYFHQTTSGVWFERDQIQLATDFQRRRNELLKLAEDGDTNAQARIGYEYRIPYSLLVDQDYAQSLRWSLPAAEAREPTACHTMYTLAANGWGCEKSTAQAVQWARRGAERGHPELQARLAMHLYSGDGIASDYSEAAGWAKKSFDAGDPWGQYIYGLMLVQGKALPADPSEGEKWIYVASSRGCRKATEYVKAKVIEPLILLAAGEILQAGLSTPVRSASDENDWRLDYEAQMGLESMAGQRDPVTWEPR